MERAESDREQLGDKPTAGTFAPSHARRSRLPTQPFALCRRIQDSGSALRCRRERKGIGPRAEPLRTTAFGSKYQPRRGGAGQEIQLFALPSSQLRQSLAAKCGLRTAIGVPPGQEEERNGPQFCEKTPGKSGSRNEKKVFRVFRNRRQERWNTPLTIPVRPPGRASRPTGSPANRASPFFANSPLRMPRRMRGRSAQCKDGDIWHGSRNVS